MSKKIRTFSELAISFHLNNPTEVQRFSDVKFSEAKDIFKQAWEMDKEDLGAFRTTNYVRRKTVMKIIGMTEQELINKMWMLEHPRKR